MTQPPTTTALIGAQIKRLRSARGWSAQQLADQLTAAGMPTSRTTISDIETGRRSYVTVDEIFALADVMHVGMTDVLHALVGNPPPPAVRVGARTWRLGRKSGKDYQTWRRITTSQRLVLVARSTGDEGSYEIEVPGAYVLGVDEEGTTS